MLGICPQFDVDFFVASFMSVILFIDGMIDVHVY